jgi:hypothetical protein
MHVTKKGDAFLIYVLPMEGVELPHHEILSYYKEFKGMFKRIMLTPSHNIAHMIAPLILKREHNLHLDPSTCSSS